LDGDERIAEALRRGELGNLSRDTQTEDTEQAMKLNLEAAA